MSTVAGWVALGGLAWLVVAVVVGPPIGRYLKRRQQDSQLVEDLSLARPLPDDVEDVAIAVGVFRDWMREGT